MPKNNKIKNKIGKKRNRKKDEVFSELEDPTKPEDATPYLRKKLVLFLIILFLIGLLFFLYKYLIIAWVDRYPVTRIEMFKVLEQRFGKDIKEQLVNERLVLNEAANRKVTVSDNEVTGEIQKIETQQGGAEKLQQVLTLQGLTMDELRKQIRLQLLIKKMFGGEGDVTSQEVEKYIEENKQQLPEVEEGDASAAAQLRQQVKDNLTQQKVSEGFSKWLQETRESLRVKRFY